MHKKLISILLILAMLFAFSGCTSVKDIITGDNSENATNKKSSTENTSDTKNVG